MGQRIEWMTAQEAVALFGGEVGDAISAELAAGVATDEPAITSFKIEQKISDMEVSGNIEVGPFANGEAKVKKVKTKYMVVMFSNKFKVFTDPEGKQIKKRMGYGYGFILNVSDINTKLTVNFSVIAASASLHLSKADYQLEIAGVVDGGLLGSMPSNSGGFDKTSYKSLQDFVAAAKKHMAEQPINRLYPIEILNKREIPTERNDHLSMYYGVKKVSEGVKLNEAVRAATSTHPKINENVVQFAYSYFEVKDAYTLPNPIQKENALNWIKGSYNKKVSEADADGRTWVAIDPVVEDGKFVSLGTLADAEAYRPHPTPADWAGAVKMAENSFSYISEDTSSRLKLASIMDSSGKLNSINIVRDISLYTDVAEGNAGNKVIETRYGVGLRLILRISNIEFGTKINYATIGAASELGHANVEYEISGIGLNDPSILKDFPGPQDITETTMAEINDAFNKLVTKLATMNVSLMKPQPYRIRIYDPEKFDATMNAQAAVFAIRHIAEREKLGTAIEAAKIAGLSEEIIKATYLRLCNITNAGDKPTPGEKRAAKEWLNLEFQV